MPDESILCLSYFDTVLGPNTFYCNTPLAANEHPDLGRILEFQDEEGTFIFAYRKYQTINHIFYIDSKIARGGKDLLMITYMIRAAYYKDEITDVYNYLLSKSRELENFASELKSYEELKELLHTGNDTSLRKNPLKRASKSFRKQFLDTFDKYYMRITPKINLATPIVGKGDLKKIYVFGPRNSGKTTFLKNLEVIQFLNYKDNDAKRNLANKVYDFFIDNIELLTYECIENDFEGTQKQLYDYCLDNAQAFILIFDASDKSSVKDTIDMFGLVSNRCLDKKEYLPVMIIGNKFHDKEEITPDNLYENLDIEELEKCGMNLQYFSINVLNEDEKIINALRWLIKQLI
jgi:signal recognition particle receptor subunit beta